MQEAIFEGDVQLDIKDGIATITFYHPKSNSLPGRVLKKLTETITELSKNDGCKVIVLQSKGDKVFCAGASFDELLSIEDFETGKAFFMGFANVINAIRQCKKFVIGRVQGKAVGGGVGVASACDYTLATEAASVKLSELAIGIGPFVVGPAVERKIGTAAFNKLAINAKEWQTANWAKQNGLFMDIYPAINELDNAIIDLTSQLVNYSPEAMLQLKKAMWAGTESWNKLLEQRAELSGQLILTDFAKQTIEKIKKKL